MNRPEHIAGVIYDVDDTLLNSQPDPDNPLSNLHQVSRLKALHTVADELRGDYLTLLEVQAQENFDSFTASPVHTVSGAFFTLLKNRGLLSGDVDPNNPIIKRLVELKNESYGKLLAVYGQPVIGADTFVRDFSSELGLNDKNAIASTAIMRDIKTFLSMHDLTHLFPDERIIDVNKVTHPKPHPEAFNNAFLSLGLPEYARSNVIAFEDDPRGMLSARKAGLYVCAITTRYPHEVLANVEARPDFIADTYKELRDYFGLPQ